MGDAIEVYYHATDASFSTALASAEVAASIKTKLGCLPLPLAALPQWAKQVGSNTSSVHTCELTVTITRPAPAVHLKAIVRDYPQLDEKVTKVANLLVGSVAGSHSETLTVVLDGHRLQLTRGVHYFTSAAALLAAASE